MYQACEHIEAIERVSNVTHSVTSDVYIKRDIPVIITDATETWPARRLFSLEFLHKVALLIISDVQILQFLEMSVVCRIYLALFYYSIRIPGQLLLETGVPDFRKMI